MLSTLKSLTCFSALFLFTFNAFGKWSYGQASMYVGDAPLEQIRTQTIKNAIADAAYKAGAVVTAEDIMLNGLLVESTVALKAQGEIERVEVVDEQLHNNILTVWVKADMKTFESCERPAYRHTLLISQIKVQNIEQTAVGSLFDIGKHVTKRLEQQIRFELSGVKTQILNQPFTLNGSLQGLSQEEVALKADYLAKTYGTQYLLFGVIRDLSMQSQIEVGFFEDNEIQRRSFTLRLYLLDNFNRKIVFEDSYHTESEWPYPLTKVIDLNSSLFWQSSFGRSLLNLINSGIVDISEQIQCRNILLPIVSMTPDGVLINAGASNGIKLGDTFELLRTSSPTLNPSISFLTEIQDSNMTVVAVNEFSSLLQPASLNLATQARVHDLLRPHD